jgi:hypothetical protein
MTTPAAEAAEDTAGPAYQGRHRALQARDQSSVETDHAAAISSLLDAHSFNRRETD